MQEDHEYAERSNEIGHLLMNSSHPRIQVESTQDILFLKEKLNQFTQTKSAKQLKEMKKWVDQVFDLASPSIEINGLPYAEAFSTPSYEPINEALRREADELQQEVLDALVRVSAMRKEIPKQIDLLNNETIIGVSHNVHSAVIGPNLDFVDVPATVAQELNIPDYSEICCQQAALQKALPETLLKAKELESLINDLELPTKSGQMEVESSTGTDSPRKAANNLLYKLQS